MGANPALAGIPLVTLSFKKFTSFSLNDRSIFPVKICTYATLLSYTIRYQGNNLWQCMPRASVMGPARDPAACMNHQLTVTTQVWSGDHQQSGRRAFTQTKPWRLRDVGLLPRIEIFSFKNWIWKCSLQNDNLHVNQRIHDTQFLYKHTLFKTLKSRQIARIWNALCWKKSSCWFRKRFGNEQTTSHYRKQNDLINRLNSVFMYR